jgi:hypothetical protein
VPRGGLVTQKEWTFPGRTRDAPKDATARRRPMPPLTSRDFLKVAAQRLIAAWKLFDAKINLDAQDIDGYAIECSLKALILEKTPQDDRIATLKRLTSGSSMHKPEVLIGELARLNVRLPLELAKQMRHCRAWTTDLRYETGRRDTGETTAFLRMAEAYYSWVQEQLS